MKKKGWCKARRPSKPREPGPTDYDDSQGASICLICSLAACTAPNVTFSAAYIVILAVYACTYIVNRDCSRRNGPLRLYAPSCCRFTTRVVISRKKKRKEKQIKTRRVTSACGIFTTPSTQSAKSPRYTITQMDFLLNITLPGVVNQKIVCLSICDIYDRFP